MTITVTGSSIVPAFVMRITAPPMVYLESINGEAAPSRLARSAGATVVWTASGPGAAFFAIYQYTGTRPAAICVFDAAANTGTLPAAVLEKLDPGSKYSFSLRGDARAETATGAFDMSGSAYSYGLDLSTSVSPVLELE